MRPVYKRPATPTRTPRASLPGMLAPDDQLFRISLCLIGGLWVVFLARSLSIMLMLFAQLSLSGDRSSAVRNTFAQILSFGQLCTYFVFTILSSLASALLWALPFLVLVFGINLFYENYSEGLVAAIRGYNEFFVTSEVYRSFDVMAKYGRLGFEMVVPAFNFIVAALRLIPLETLRLSLQAPAQASITGMIAALGALITDGAQGIGEMLARERTLCQVGVVQEAARRDAHPCLDFEYRALDLRAANGKLGEAVGHAIQLTGVLCPFASGIATVVLYPLVDVNFQAMLEHLVNAAWALLYSVWRITQLRCAMPDVASALCVPDMGPVFVFTERAVESLAKVLDRWFDVVFIQVLQVFVEREPGESCTSPPPLRSIQGNRGTHDVVAVLPLGLSRVAAVTSTAVQVHMGGAADAHTRVLNSSQAITMRYGTAAVQFGNDADEQDRRQGVLGCRCDDRAPPQRGVQLSCTIVPPDGNDEPVTVALEATDASAAAVEQQQCADLLISVQPAHQDLQRSDCLQNDGIGGCSDIDALVYVMPECGRGGGSVACIRNSVLAFCFPFCVAVHHAGGGSRPLRLHRATQLENGGRVLLHQLFASTTTALRELEAFAETPVRDASAPLLDVLGRSEEQPYAFAGPFALYESLQDTGSLRNITVQRLTLSAGNALRLETQLTGILLPANAVPNRDLRPSSQRNLACAMPRGVLFYAINDADDGVAAILTQSFGISGTNLGVPGSLLRLDPLNQCARTASVSAPAARWCGDGLITRIDTAAAFGIVWPQSTSVAKQLLDSNSPTGLFIESVQRFDALNVLVAVRHGPLADLRYENGRQVPPAGHTTTTRSRFYFVHVDSLAVQENRVHYPAALALRTECLAQQPLPPVFRLITQVAIVQVRILRVVINDFALNGIGVIEDLLSTNDACAGRAYLHSAFDQCSAQRPQPLSFGAARAALVTLHEHWRDVITHTVEVLFLTFAQENTIVDRFFVSVGLLLFGPDAGNMAVLLQSVISNVAPAARNLALTLPKIGGRLVSIGMVNVLVLYEAYALPVLKFCLRELAQQTFAPGRLWHFATRTHYDAVRGGSLEDHILRPLDRTCFLAAELAWEPSNPIGRSILQGCRASVETLRVVLVASAEVLAVPIAHDCLCRATPTDDFCSTVIPIPWRVFYARVQAGREARSQICAEVVDRTGVQLFNAPVRLTRLLSQFGDALADTAAFLPSLTGVPGLDFTECTHPERNLDSVVMLPQPVIAFAACGLTPTCRTKCGLEIQAFEEAKLERRIQPQTYVEPGQKHALRALGPSPDLPAFDALHANLYTRSDDAWKNGDTDCLYHIVLLARERRSDWELRFFCLRTEEVGGLETERAPVSLPGTSGWRVLEVADRANDDGIGDAIEVEFLGMSPQLFNPDRTAWGVLVVQTFDTEARRSRVHRFTVAMDGSLVEDVLLDSSTVVIEQTSTVQLKQMVEQQCPFKDTFEELELVEAAATDAQHTRLTSLAILHADDSTSTSFFLVANTLIKFRDTDASTCTIPVQILAYAPYDKPTPVVDVRTGEDLLPERARGFRPHVLNEVGTQRVHIVRVETLCTYELVHNTSMHTLSATLTEAGCRDLDSDLYSFTGTARALVRAPDDPSSLRVLQVKAAANSLVARWAQELRFELDDTPVKIVRAQGITIDMTITHEQECGYMTCTSCSMGSVQKLCMAAQNCMLMECIGTRVHTGSVFCSLGLLTREFGERHYSDFIVLWQGFVEIVQVGIRTGVLGFRAAGPIRIEALSNHLTTAMCEGKDIVAVGSALLPTLTTTIVNAGRGVRLSDFSLHPSSHAFVAMSRLLSPAQRLLEIQYVSAATQVLYQLALAGVHYLYVNARILLCAMRTFNVMTGNHIEFIDHDVNVESDVCSIFLATSSYYDQNTEDRIRNLERVASSTSVGVTAVQDARGQSLVRNGDAIAVDVLRTIGTFGYADRLRRRAAARQSPKWRSRLDYRVVLFYFTAAIDWFTGLLTSFALWSKLLDPECTAAPVEMVGAMRCVCGDREAYIPRYKAEWSPQTFEPGSGDPSLWCSGILQLNDQDGVVRFIDQPYSFVELLDAWQEHGMHQLACVAFHGLDFDGCNMYCPELSNEAEREAEINRGNCQRSNVRPGSTTLDLNLGRVSPLAVLARCRENYAKKRWDPGLFAAFHEPTGQISELTTEALQRVRTLVQGLQSPLLEDCLARGPVTQNIEVCTSVYFQSPHPDAARRAASRRAYFVYGPEPSGTTTAEPDACEFLSAPFGDGFWPDETQSKIEACQSEDIPRIFARDVVNATCGVALTTRSMDRGRQDSVVDMFLDDGVVEIPDTVYAEDIEAMHNWLGDYTLPTVDDLRTHDFALESFEGDFLHRLVDCVVQGPYPEVALMPADSLGLAEALVFATPLGNASTEPLPDVFDRHAPERTQVASQTRGSGTRIALINALLFEQRQNFAQQVHTAMDERVKHIQAKFVEGNLNAFKNADGECSASRPEHCEPAEELSTFLPLQDITGQPDTSILDKIRTQGTVSLCFFCIEKVPDGGSFIESRFCLQKRRKTELAQFCDRLCAQPESSTSNLQQSRFCVDFA